jgi:hypothetical protein
VSRATTGSVAGLLIPSIDYLRSPAFGGHVAFPLMSTPTTPDGNRGDTPSKSGLHPWLGRESRLSAWIRRHDFYPLIRVQLTIGAWAFVIASGALVWAWAAEDLVRPTLALVLAAPLVDLAARCFSG